MFRILVATFALSILFGAAALHAQVPYTSSPYPWAQQQPRQQSPWPSVEQQLWRDTFQAPDIQQFQPQPLEQRQWDSLNQPQQSQLFEWSFDHTQETYWQKMQREDLERMQRYSDQVLQEFQAEAQERATRCARRGSRKIYADCMDW